LDDTGLVVDEHHGDDGGAVVERGRERVEVDATVGTGTDRRDAEAVAREARRRADDGLVLDPGRDDAVAGTALRAIQAAPFTARLSASLPLPVNTISEGVAASAPATDSRATSSAFLPARDAP
jgi:hypothetical protein